MSHAARLPEEREERDILREESLGRSGAGVGGTSLPRAANRASSQCEQLVLDSGSLAALTHYLDRMVDQVTAQMELPGRAGGLGRG